MSGDVPKKSENDPIIHEISKVTIDKKPFARSIIKTDNIFVSRSSFIELIKNGIPFDLNIDLAPLDVLDAENNLTTEARTNFNSIALFFMSKLNETQWSWGSLLSYPRCLFGVCMGPYESYHNNTEKRYIRDYDRIIIYHTCLVMGVSHDCMSVILIPYFIGSNSVELDMVTVVMYHHGIQKKSNIDELTLKQAPFDLLEKCFGFTDPKLKLNVTKVEINSKLECLYYLLNLANYLSITNINVASKLDEYIQEIVDGNDKDIPKVTDIMKKSLFIGRAPFIFPYSSSIKNVDYKRLGEITPDRLTNLMKQGILLKVAGFADISTQEIDCMNGESGKDSESDSDSELGELSSALEKIIKYNYPPIIKEIESCSED